jgi:hypothetical protein
VLLIGICLRDFLDFQFGVFGKKSLYPTVSTAPSHHSSGYHNSSHYSSGYYNSSHTFLDGEGKLAQFLVLNGAWFASGGPRFWAPSSGRPVQDVSPPMSLIGMHFSGMRLLRARISYGVPPTICLSHRHVSHRRASRRRASSVLSHKTYIEYSRRIVIIEAKDDMLGREIGVPTLAPVGRATGVMVTRWYAGNSAASDSSGFGKSSDPPPYKRWSICSRS